MYAVWDTVGQLGWNIGSGIFAEFHVLDDTVLRKVNESDASQFARICGCFPSQGKSHILHNRGCPITQVFFFFLFFLLSLGCHLVLRGGHIFRSWRTRWSCRIQSQSLVLFILHNLFFF